MDFAHKETPPAENHRHKPVGPGQSPSRMHEEALAYTRTPAPEEERIWEQVRRRRTNRNKPETELKAIANDDEDKNYEEDQTRENSKENEIWPPAGLRGRGAKTKRTVTRILDEPVKTYNRFYLLESIEENRTLKDICTFQAYRDIKTACVEEPEDLRVLRNGTILIKAKNYDQSESIKKLKKLDGVEINPKPHKKLNSTQGTIISNQLAKYSVERIQEELHNEGVTEVVKLPKRQNSKLGGDIYLLTFDRYEIPGKIRVGMERKEVRQYIPRPRRCFNCQAFGHVGKYCKKPTGICPNCSQNAHLQRDEVCRRTPKCKNCEQEHPTNYSRCPIYRREQEIITIVTKEKVSFWEARKRVKAAYPDQETSYADVTRRRMNQRAQPRPEMNQPTKPWRSEVPERREVSEHTPQEIPENINLPEPIRREVTLIQECTVTTKERETEKSNETNETTKGKRKGSPQKGNMRNKLDSPTTPTTKKAHVEKPKENREEKSLPKQTNEKTSIMKMDFPPGYSPNSVEMDSKERTQKIRPIVSNRKEIQPTSRDPRLNTKEQNSIYQTNKNG